VIEFGDFTPTASLTPQRSAGAIILPRLTTTDEQWSEAREWAREQMQAHGMRTGDQGRATVHWARFEPSVVVFTTAREHLSTKPVWFVAAVQELTLGGVEVPRDEGARFEVLDAEVADLHERGLL